MDGLGRAWATLLTLAACARVTVLALSLIRSVHRAVGISDHFYALVRL